MINELGLNTVNNIASTYMKSLKPVEKIVSNNASILKYKFDREVIAVNKKLLNIYWTTKLHKNPTKTRFIIAAPNCFVKAP